MGSEYSSGCESGWTMYLEHSMNPSSSLRDPAAFLVDENNGNRERWRTVDHEMGGEEPEEEEEEEEDNLSMVSDASSPNLQDQHQLGYLSFNPKTEEDFSPNMKKSTQKLHHQKRYNRHESESTQFRDDTQMDCFLNVRTYITVYMHGLK